MRKIAAAVLRIFQERLTLRGRYLFIATGLLALIALNIRATNTYLLFSAMAGVLIGAMALGLKRAPRVNVECQLPVRATAGTSLAIRARIVCGDGPGHPDLLLQFRSPAPAVTYVPVESFFSCTPKEPAQLQVEFRAARRGRYELTAPAVRSTDPLRLLTSRTIMPPASALLVYPRYYSMEEFSVPLGRKYQPGGIPLSSNTGDSIEFIGTRDYREGDAIKNIHWRSWARRGKPVVKEFQEEYFCRIAIILDTFLPKGAKQSDSFEAAISVVASITDFFSRSEYVVDILAAGPDIYEVSAGRSLAYLENVLDVLACLEPCYEPPFASIGPPLMDKLEQITTVVAVLQDWDEQRAAFLRRVKSLGAAVRAIVVHDGATTIPWTSAGDDLGEINQLTPADVERLIAR